MWIVSDPFLDKEDIAGIHHRLTTYLEREKDVRGYADNKGWAHAPAHAADAVEDLAQSPYLERTDLLEPLHALRRCKNNGIKCGLHP